MADKTWISGWQHTLDNNATTSSYPSIAVQETKPATVHTAASAHLVVQLPDGRRGNNILAVLPFGTDAANETFEIKIVGWRMISGTNTFNTAAAPAGSRGSETTDGLWIPTTMGIYTCTIGTMTGINATAFENENLLCDTIVEVTSTGTPAIGAHADNLSSCLFIDMLGFQYADIYFNRATAATANCLATTL